MKVIKSSHNFCAFLTFLKSNDGSGIISQIKEISLILHKKELPLQFDLLELDLLRVNGLNEIKCFNLLKSVKHLYIEWFEAKEIYQFIYKKKVEFLSCTVDETMLDNYYFLQKIKFTLIEIFPLPIQKKDFIKRLKLFVSKTKNLKYFGLFVPFKKGLEDYSMFEEKGIQLYIKNFS